MAASPAATAGPAGLRAISYRVAASLLSEAAGHATASIAPYGYRSTNLDRLVHRPERFEVCRAHHPSDDRRRLQHYGDGSDRGDNKAGGGQSGAARGLLLETANEAHRRTKDVLSDVGRVGRSFGHEIESVVARRQR